MGLFNRLALLVAFAVTALPADAGFLPARNLGIIGRYKRQYQIRVVKRETAKIASRVPHALLQSAVDFTKGYSTTTAMMIPVEVALHYGDIKEKGYREVLVSSSRKASEWGTRSGIYRATESFLSEMRQQKDRWNSFFASGITSTITKRKPNGGSFQTLKSFCSGFGTALAIDTVKSVTRENGAKYFDSIR